MPLIPPSESPVAQVDHVAILAEDAEGLFHLFRDILHIPEAWPMADYGGFESAAVRPQNLNLEFLRINERNRAAVPVGRSAILRLIGLAPSGSVADTIERLDRRGIEHSSPKPGQQWTIVSLTEFLPGHSVLFCHYSPEASRVFPTLYTTELRDRQGGPLGIERVQEVVVGVPDLGAAIASWGNLFAPHPSPEPGLWSVGAGPSVRLEAASTPQITRLVFRVTDLPRAVAFLREQGLLGEATSKHATIARERLGSLQVNLVPSQ